MWLVVCPAVVFPVAVRAGDFAVAREHPFREQNFSQGRVRHVELGRQRQGFDRLLTERPAFARFPDARPLASAAASDADAG